MICCYTVFHILLNHLLWNPYQKKNFSYFTQFIQIIRTHQKINVPKYMNMLQLGFGGSTPHFKKLNSFNHATCCSNVWLEFPSEFSKLCMHVFIDNNKIKMFGEYNCSSSTDAGSSMLWCSGLWLFCCSFWHPCTF